MRKILVIDDEEWLREMVQLALAQRGYDVVEAPNGAAGVQVARKELPDLVLCDVNMEKMDGYGALSSLRNEPATASIPFILMTGLADNAGCATAWSWARTITSPNLLRLMLSTQRLRRG